MSETAPPPSETPITLGGISKWQGLVVGLLTGAAVAGATYTAASISIATATEKSESAIHKVAELERKLQKVDAIESRQQGVDAKMDKILSGIDAVDRKLFALVCSKDPSKCDEYKPAFPR